MSVTGSWLTRPDEPYVFVTRPAIAWGVTSILLTHRARKLQQRGCELLAPKTDMRRKTTLYGSYMGELGGAQHYLYWSDRRIRQFLQE
jgi:hypothetical protein